MKYIFLFTGVFLLCLSSRAQYNSRIAFTPIGETSMHYKAIGVSSLSSVGCNSNCNNPTHIIEKSPDIIGFQVFPNPGDGLFFVRSGNIISQIEVVNVLGEKVYFSKINADKSEIDLSKEPPGVYLVWVKTNEGTAVRKIIKE